MTEEEELANHHTQIVDVAQRLAQALRDFAYTRKDEDKKKIIEIQQELLKLCPN